jgi:iron(III) transport system permease protein
MLFSFHVEDSPQRAAGSFKIKLLQKGYQGSEIAMLAPLIFLVTCLSVLPVFRLLWESVFPHGQMNLGILLSVLGEQSTWRAAWHTVETGLGGTLISLLLGGFFAIIVALTDIRLKSSLVFCFMLPMMIPPQITALSWLQLLAPTTSPILRWLGLTGAVGTINPLYSREGIILLLGVQHAPLVFLSLRAGLRHIPREMVEAAQSSGASRRQVLMNIVLPLMTPPLIAGAALAFVTAVGNFGIPAMLGIPARYTVLTTLIYQYLSNFGPEIISETAVICLVIGILAFIGLIFQNYILNRKDFRLVGAPSQALNYQLGSKRLLVEAGCWLIIFLILVLPLFALATTSLIAAYGVPLTWENTTLGNYTQVMFHYDATIRAFRNSFCLAAAAAVLLVLISVPMAYFLVWRSNPVMKILNTLTELPYALPGVVIGIATILLYLKPLPILNYSIYGTIWILAIAYLSRFLPLALKPVISGFQQMDRVLEEAAQSAGAGFLKRLRTIIFPLLTPAAVAGSILVFLTAFNELTVSILLWSSGSETIGVIIYSLDESGDPTLASAVAMLTVAAILVLMLFAAALSRKLPRGALPWQS